MNPIRAQDGFVSAGAGLAARELMVMCEAPIGLDAVTDAFWHRLAAASRAALMLDYDGTLAPFTVDRDRALPYEGVRERLESIGRGRKTRLIIISGRTVEDVQRLLRIEPMPEVWGIHGFERWTKRGGLDRLPVQQATREALETACARGSEVVRPERIERKPAAVAFHWRGLSEVEAERIRRGLEQRLESLTRPAGLELHPFDGGLELRVSGITKERAVRMVRDEMGESAVLAYLGDDRTDEDAFRALREVGLAILVRSEPRATAAQVRLVPPRDVLGFLDRWSEVRREAPDA